MDNYTRAVEIRWSDLDPNFHIRHSVYYDLGAFCRMSFLNEHGITAAVMQEYHTGPIIFREECLFKSEVKFGDAVTINLQLTSVSADQRKFSMRHEIFKNGETVAAIINIDAAWMDTQLRKVTVPPAIFMPGFEAIPKSTDFINPFQS